MSADPLLLVKMVALLLSIGAVGGFLAGLLGVGGGIIFTPALAFCLTAMGVGEHHVMQVAVGSSLAIISVTGVMSVFSHWRRGGVDTQSLRLWAPALVTGVAIGGVFAGIAPGHFLRAIFASVTIILSLYMFLTPKPKNPDACLVVPVKIQRLVMLVTGAIAAMIGVGGAVMTVPFMLLMGFPMPRASGTGSATGLIIAVPAAATYIATGLFHPEGLPPYSLGYVNLLAVGLIIPTSLLMAPFGVQASYAMSRDVLRRVFAVVILIVSLRMFMTL